MPYLYLHNVPPKSNTFSNSTNKIKPFCISFKTYDSGRSVYHPLVGEWLRKSNRFGNPTNKIKPFCITFKNIWFRQKGLSCSGRWIKPFWKPYKQNRTLLHIIKNITFKQWCLSECLIWRSKRILQQMFRSFQFESFNLQLKHVRTQIKYIFFFTYVHINIFRPLDSANVAGSESFSNLVVACLVHDLWVG